MNAQEKKFVATVLEFYKRHGRHSLPWRLTKNPYKILVSEIMLQQTQVERVVPKYKEFLKLFPTVETLAVAPLKDVLVAWQGLGYNRRAKMLHMCAQQLCSLHKGKFPKNKEGLIALRGVGPYTASALLAFAFNTRTVLIETNVRAVYLHHFFRDAADVTDAELLVHIERTLPPSDFRSWYFALMDYGAHLKKEFENPNRRSKHHVVQSTFKGSDRQIRGALIRLLSKKNYTRKELLSLLNDFEDIRVDAQLQKLMQEGMIVQKRKVFLLP